MTKDTQGYLTNSTMAAILYRLSSSLMTVRFDTRKKINGAGYAPFKAHGFFYTLKKDAGLIRVLFLVMAGSVRAASVFAACQPDANRHPSVDTFDGGYSKLKTESPQMSQDKTPQAQTEQTHIQELQALISQINYWSDAVIDAPSSRSTLSILTDEVENLLVHLKAMRDRLAAIAGGAK